MSAEINQKIRALKAKVEHFAQKFSENKRKLVSLEQENANLKAQINEKTVKVEELEQQLKIAKLSDQIASGSETSAEENKVLRKKLNEYIKEIDKCVALLNN